ncbi:MAG: C25 family cysteine peptidase [Candidatus Wallbacteria bacterium]|nr:C25 family cysteine peptidase [Candidatus Wallbacteria bacterium]
MKLLGILLLVAFITTSAFATEWIALDKGVKSNSASKSVIKDTETEIIITVNVPGYAATDRSIDGQDCISLSLEGTSPTMTKGDPELRKVTAFVALPACSSATARVVDSSFVIKDSNTIVPSRGTIMRNQDPSSVPYEFGPSYKVRGWYPLDSELVTVSAPFIFRDQYGVRLEVTPFQYDNQKKKLKVYSNFKIAITPIGISKGFFRSQSTSGDFEGLYSKVFMNYTAPVRVAKGASVPAVKKNLLIIAGDTMLDSVKALKDWKVKCGYTVDVVKASDAGKTGDELKTFLQKQYDAGKLCFVILVGDAEQIPTLKGKQESADSDACLVKLAGNDNVQDAFISRISVENKDQADYVIAKSIAYEQNPMQGADGAWYKQALGIASSQAGGDDNMIDYDRIKSYNKELQGKLGFTTIFECYDGSGASTQKIFDACKSGVSIINYCGHGGDTEWVTTGFSNDDCANLQNGMKLPVIWDVACVNGAFVGQTCFAEAWLRTGTKAKPAGTIGMAAATTNMAWYPPCIWQKEIVNEQICGKKNQIAQVINLFGILKTMEQFGVEDSSKGNQVNEQVVYFGDGTVALRFAPAREIQVQKSSDANNAQIQILGGGTEDITVTLYDDKGENIVTVKPDETGVVRTSLRGQTMFTVYGPGIVPLIDEQL